MKKFFLSILLLVFILVVRPKVFDVIFGASKNFSEENEIIEQREVPLTRDTIDSNLSK